jgi:hypothetical protein
VSSAGGGDTRTLQVIRRVLGLLLLAALVGTFVELLLLEHDEDAWQLIPLALLTGGVVTLVSTAIRPAPLTVAAFRLVMMLMIVGGVLGFGLHFRANLEFQRELTPAGTVSDLFWKAVSAKTPPALAPGVLAQLGCLGLIYAYRFPAGRTAAGRHEGESHVTIR